MGNVVFDMSMSLDGYIAAPNDNPEQWAGEDGMRLHNWAFDDRSLFELRRPLRGHSRTVAQSKAAWPIASKLVTRPCQPLEEAKAAAEASLPSAVEWK
jgi:hypothetical protein